ncbi:GAF domain-containing protein [Saccharothrix syringae]|uniref:GAF domain-containing protein n=1 Tax=Saccharothrix syringae TaxID=103733 RepID=A0A5Q0GY87_SACSY|nr:GAF domain-containing protein [Saccharothrix syringae]QFZ18941.1 GAF domain-containing protein [Saccharothrix syringae]
MSDPIPIARRSLARGAYHVIRQAQQSIIDAEVRASRLAILRSFHHRLSTDPGTLTTDAFLAVADPEVLRSAIIIAARSRADACDLQVRDPATGNLLLVAHHGFRPDFLDYFAVVDASVPSACGLALATGAPVLVDDVGTSPVFSHQPTRQVVLSAGFHAVQSYPLLDEHGEILGMLSLHYRTPGLRDGHEVLVEAVARTMARLGR